MAGLTAENSETIGFALACFSCSAISLDEFRKWCLDMIERLEVRDIPPYLFELADYEGQFAGVYQIVGFVPTWDHSEDEELALYGIAKKRGVKRYEWPVDPDLALKKLTENPGVEKRFKDTFRFIQY